MPSDETDEKIYESSGTETNDDDDDGKLCLIISREIYYKCRIIGFEQKFESSRKKYTMVLPVIGQIVLVIFWNNRELF